MQSFDENNDLLNIYFFNELKYNFVEPKQQHDRYFNCFKSIRGKSSGGQKCLCKRRGVEWSGGLTR